jgi:hypothetical protein
VLRPTAGAPWADAALIAAAHGLGSDALGLQAACLLRMARADSTYRAYSTGLTHWCRFLRSEGLARLEDAGPAAAVRFLAWLGLRGTVSAATARCYLTAVAAVYKDLGLPDYLERGLASAARRGLEGAQHRLVPQLPRVPLPAGQIVGILDLAATLVQDASGTPEALRTLRDCLATVTSYVYFNRASSTYSLLRAGLLVDSTMGADDLIRLRATTRKGSSHRHLVATEFRIPVVAQPLLAAGLRYFSAQLPDDREFFWELPGDPPPASWTAETQTGWLHSALAASGQPLPDNVAWTSHSLRYGSASAAYAAGVDLPRIRYFGGWSPSSRVTETTYLDLSTPPSQAGTILFQWMSSAQLGASSLEEHSDSEPDSDGPTGNSRDPQGTIFRSTATFQRPEAGSTLADLGAR